MEQQKNEKLQLKLNKFKNITIDFAIGISETVGKATPILAGAYLGHQCNVALFGAMIGWFFSKSLGETFHEVTEKSLLKRKVKF